MLDHSKKGRTVVGRDELIDLIIEGDAHQKLGDASAQVVFDPPQRNRFALVKVIVLKQVGAAGKDERLQFHLQLFAVAQDGCVALGYSAGAGIQVKVGPLVKFTNDRLKWVAPVIDILFRDRSAAIIIFLLI